MFNQINFRLYLDSKIFLSDSIMRVQCLMYFTTFKDIYLLYIILCRIKKNDKWKNQIFTMY